MLNYFIPLQQTLTTPWIGSPRRLALRRQGQLFKDQDPAETRPDVGGPSPDQHAPRGTPPRQAGKRSGGRAPTALRHPRQTDAAPGPPELRRRAVTSLREEHHRDSSWPSGGGASRWRPASGSHHPPVRRSRAPITRSHSVHIIHCGELNPYRGGGERAAILWRRWPGPDAAPRRARPRAAMPVLRSSAPPASALLSPRRSSHFRALDPHQPQRARPAHARIFSAS